MYFGDKLFYYSGILVLVILLYSHMLPELHSLSFLQISPDASEGQVGWSALMSERNGNMENLLAWCIDIDIVV